MIARSATKFKKYNFFLASVGAIPRKQRFATPLFLLMGFLGVTFIIASLWALFAEQEARRDAIAFGQGQYQSTAWFTFDRLDPILTRTDAATRQYNEGIYETAVYLRGVSSAQEDQSDADTAIYSAASALLKATQEAATSRDAEMIAKTNSALGAMLFLVALKTQDATLIDQIETSLVKALEINPHDEDASWNLEMLRRIEGSQNQQNDKNNGQQKSPAQTGAGGLDPGKGGL